jgi:hypothetical protein
VVFCWDKGEDVKPVLTGGENLNKLSLGRENSKKLVQVGKPLKINAFLKFSFSNS